MTTAPHENPIDLNVLHEFVSGSLSKLYARQVRDTHQATWCPEWWRHDEAVEVLELLRLGRLAIDDWLSWSDWWALHARPHMAALLDMDGPFKFCSVHNGHKDMLDPLPCTPPPTGLRAAPAAA